MVTTRKAQRTAASVDYKALRAEYGDLFDEFSDAAKAHISKTALDDADPTRTAKTLIDETLESVESLDLICQLDYSLLYAVELRGTSLNDDVQRLKLQAARDCFDAARLDHLEWCVLSAAVCMLRSAIKRVPYYALLSGEAFDFLDQYIEYAEAKLSDTVTQLVFKEQDQWEYSQTFVAAVKRRAYASNKQARN